MPTNAPPNEYTHIKSDILIQTTRHTTCDSDTVCLLTLVMAAAIQRRLVMDERKAEA